MQKQNRHPQASSLRVLEAQTRVVGEAVPFSRFSQFSPFSPFYTLNPKGRFNCHSFCRYSLLHLTGDYPIVKYTITSKLAAGTFITARHNKHVPIHSSPLTCYKDLSKPFHNPLSTRRLLLIAGLVVGTCAVVVWTAIFSSSMALALPMPYPCLTMPYPTGQGECRSAISAIVT